MIGLWILLALQFATAALGFGFLWRRQQRLSAEIAQLRETLAGQEVARVEAAAGRRRPRLAEQVAAATRSEGAAVIALAPETPILRAKRARAPVGEGLNFNWARLRPDAARGLALGAAAAAPALGFFASVPAPVLVVAGIGVATAMMLLGLRQEWRAATWAGVMTAAAWALVGFAFGAAQASPIQYCVFVSVAALAGLTHAQLRGAAPGSLMALTMAAAALALASQAAIIGPAGIGFGVIVAAAAIIGGMSLRLEGVHVAAFGAALIGLFVLSGQREAAIWFTPVTTWAGALFLGVAAVRVPQLGSRGLGLAGIGALAPLLALGVLHLAHHGLDDAFAAAGALAALGAMLCGVLAAAALRRLHGVAALKATAWVLAAGAFTAFAAAILLAAPAPFAAPAFAALALGLALLNARLPDAVWRPFACIAALFAAACALAAGGMLLNEAQRWLPAVLLGLGLAAPAALAAAAARFAHRAQAGFTAGVLEAVAFALGVIGANLAVRLYFSGGAMLLQPVGFVEAGAHISIWLLASLLIASRSSRGSKPVRICASMLLALIALTLAAFGGGLWLTPYWGAREAAIAPITHAPLGFLAPAVLFWAHWVFWRARGTDTRARTALAAAALLTAAFVTLELMRWPHAPEWLAALGGAVAFALAIVVNFAPGVTFNGA